MHRTDAAIKAEQPDAAIRELQDILDAEADMTEWYVDALTQGIQGAQAADQDPFPSGTARRGAADLSRTAQVYQVSRNAKLHVRGKLMQRKIGQLDPRLRLSVECVPRDPRGILPSDRRGAGRVAERPAQHED